MNTLLQILKPLLEVLIHEIFSLFTAPVKVLEGQKPVLDSLASDSFSVSPYFGLLEGHD